MCTADPGWVTGTSYGIISPLTNGVTSIVDEADFDAERWYAILRDQKVTVWYTAPTAVGVIYPPQVALVGFGKVVERPWAVRGLLGVRSAVTATLAADHRVSDGHRGALFLAAIERLLSQPEKL